MKSSVIEENVGREFAVYAKNGVVDCEQCLSKAHLFLDLKSRIGLFENISAALISCKLNGDFESLQQKKFIENFFQYADSSLLSAFLELTNHKKIRLSPGIFFYQLIDIFGDEKARMILDRLTPGARNLVRNDPVVRVSVWTRIFPESNNNLKQFF